MTDSVRLLVADHAAPATVSWVLRLLGFQTGQLSAEDRFSLFLYEPFWLLGGILFGLAAWEHRRALRGNSR